jgi:hypothetical protein
MAESKSRTEAANRDQTAGSDKLHVPAGSQASLESDANPEAKKNVSTGPVGEAQVIDAQEHVLGDDPRRNAHHEGGFHDSLSGRPVDESGNFTDSAMAGSNEGPIPKHRIVANNWPQEREKIDDPAKREGNEAAKA